MILETGINEAEYVGSITDAESSIPFHIHSSLGGLDTNLIGLRDVALKKPPLVGWQ